MSSLTKRMCIAITSVVVAGGAVVGVGGTASAAVPEHVQRPLSVSRPTTTARAAMSATGTGATTAGRAAITTTAGTVATHTARTATATVMPPAVSGRTCRCRPRPP